MKLVNPTFTHFSVARSFMGMLVSIAAAMVLLVTSTMAHAESLSDPEKVVRDTINSIVQNIQANRDEYRADSGKLHRMIENTLVPALHVPRMANLILGKEVSRSASPDQKRAFAEAFKTALIKQYGPLLLDFAGNSAVEFSDAKVPPGADKVVVNAKLVAASGDKFPISLYMSNRKDTRWRAYNMEVAGINFVATYRLTYGGIIREKGIDGLIADLNSKNAR